MGAYVDVNDADFESTVLKSDVPVLVDFWAPWCGPCRAIAPHVEAVGEAFEGKLKVVKVNTDNNTVQGQYGVRGIPALILFKDGQVVDRMQGMPPNTRARLTKFVEQAL